MPLWYCYFRFRRTIFSVCFLSQPSSPSVRSSVPTDCSVMKPVCTVCGCSRRWTHWPTVSHLHHHVGNFSLIWYLCFITVYYNVVAAFQLDHMRQTLPRAGPCRWFVLVYRLWPANDLRRPEQAQKLQNASSFSLWLLWTDSYHLIITTSWLTKSPCSKNQLDHFTSIIIIIPCWLTRH